MVPKRGDYVSINPKFKTAMWRKRRRYNFRDGGMIGKSTSGFPVLITDSIREDRNMIYISWDGGGSITLTDKGFSRDYDIRSVVFVNPDCLKVRKFCACKKTTESIYLGAIEVCAKCKKARS